MISIHYPALYLLDPQPGVSIRHYQKRRAGQRTGPPKTSAWPVIWSGVVRHIRTLHYHIILDKDFSETSLRHEYVTISSRRDGPIDFRDLSLFQLSQLGQEGGGKLKFA